MLMMFRRRALLFSSPPISMAAIELKLKISSARDLKNVNWRHGSLKPYVSAWLLQEPTAKFSTNVDPDGDTSPSWNQTLHIPIGADSENSSLHLEILHHNSDGEDDTKPVVGSATLSLRDLGDSGVVAVRTLDLRRPSGRPQGKLEVEVQVTDSLRGALVESYAAPCTEESGAGPESVLDEDAVAGELAAAPIRIRLTSMGEMLTK